MEDVRNDPDATSQETTMTDLHSVPAARPFVVPRGEGEHIWFGDTVMEIKASAATTEGHLSLIDARAPVGFGPALHVHHDEHEAFFILEGELELICGGERSTAGSGAFVFLPRGIAHTFRVIGDRPVRMLSIGSPGGMENFFREGGRPAEDTGLPPATPVDVPALQAIAVRHNLEFVGPPLAAMPPAAR
jgi:mannose-6-phosphate isomerase-like protein (cupin superfamily)